MNLLDTTVAIDFLRGHERAKALLLRLVEGGERLAASEVTRFELLRAVRPSEEPALETFFEAVTFAEVSEGVARAAGAFARRFRRSNAAIDDLDYIVAATAVLLDARLLTTNVRHFPMIDGLAAAY